MRIVHTESSLGWGGQEMRILAEARGLIGRGHEVFVLCPPEARLHSEARALRVPAISLPIATKSIRGLRSLIEWLRTNQPDVVGTHSQTDSWLAALALLVLRRPCPMVRMLSAPVRRNAPTRWLHTRAASRIVTMGEQLKKDLVERNGFRAVRIDSVPTGIDPSRFRPGDRTAARTRLNLPQEETLVGIVARLRKAKGHRYLLEALAGLPKTVGLVIVGDGPMRAQLETLVDKLDVRSRVRFAGEQADVAPWLHALDVFVLPCEASDGVPQALVQAMLAGLPCVTTAAGGLPEVARDGVTALIVAPQEVASLRDAIRKVIDDSDLAHRLGTAARGYCETRFSYKRMLDRMERIYREVSGRA